MTICYNKSPQREVRRRLRRNAPAEEAKLWKFLCNHKMMGYKFRRQYGIDSFVLDFYCPELKLAIEIDGEYHDDDDVRAQDIARQEHIEAYGVLFLRLTNHEIEYDITGSLHKISEKIHSLKIQLKQNDTDRSKDYPMNDLPCNPLLIKEGMMKENGM